MQRRALLNLAAYGAGALAIGRRSAAQQKSIHHPIIDAHIHLFDPTRPGGVPWPEKDDAVLYKPSTPERYVATSAKFGVVGAIAIEASPLASDNEWLLNVATNHPVIVGIIGDLVPGNGSQNRIRRGGGERDSCAESMQRAARLDQLAAR